MHFNSAAGLIALFFIPISVGAQRLSSDSAFVVDNYKKIERMIPMRDGVRLFTSIYMPKDENEQYPFLIVRTPYGCAPYGEGNLSKYSIGPNRVLMLEKYIFVNQDVRGRYKSEGNFEEMTPAIDSKKSSKDIDESSDAYDTIDWLLKNIKNNNGKAGIYGISYDGFYASASLPNAHPALKAVSPQAPMSDEFIGDDAYHNGAFMLISNFGFSVDFLGERIDSGRDYKDAFIYDHKDAYAFYKTLGPLKNTNDSKYYNKQAKIWNEYLQHNVYDEYWKARNIRTHLKNIKPAVLIVGGWFDVEDLFGTLQTYKSIKEQSPSNSNIWLVMGPWGHAEWRAKKQYKRDTYNFEDQNPFFHEEIETKFFNHYLKDKGDFKRPPATIFNTGTGSWKEYSSWPLTDTKPERLYLQQGGNISASPSTSGYDEYVSDPSNPVPYVRGIYGYRNNNYIVGDQRFASERKDVLVYKTDTLTRDVTVTGELNVDLFISTTGTDADFIVKLIDVLPGNEPDFQITYTVNNVSHTDTCHPAGIQRLQRAEVFRAKFRNSFEKPEALIPWQLTEIKFDMNDIAHTFKKGHHIMVQVQSSWFPLIDMNPQKFVNISTCDERDFHSSTMRVYHNSSITLPVVQQ
jgi:uncharacterized protein